MNFNTVYKFIVNKKYRFLLLSNLGYFKSMDDKSFLEKKYNCIFDRSIDWDNPKYYSEKLQCLKIYDRNESYITLVDKFEVRKVVKEKIGEEYLIPLLGVWSNPDEIDFNILPDKFVLKCNHNSGLGMYICTDKSRIDKKAIIKNLKKGIKQNYYFPYREWPYKEVKPKIICEQYIGISNKAPDDYKFLIINGKIELVFVCKFRETGNPKFFYFDLDWNRIYCQYEEPNVDCKIEKPVNFDEMVSLVYKLAEGINNVRIDLYNVEGKIYFGEYTMYDSAGFDTDITAEEDLRRGEKLIL